MNIKTFIEKLRILNACDPGVEDAAQYETFQSAWFGCQRGDYLIWLATMLMEHKRAVMAACECARLALPYTNDPHGLTCIETTEAWCHDEASIEDVRASANAARAAYATRAAARAANATRAAAYAADAAAYAARAASYTSYAARAAAYADAAHAPYASVAILARCADIVREHFTVAEIEETLKGVK